MAAAQDHEQALFQVMLDGLGAMEKVTLYGKAHQPDRHRLLHGGGLDPS